MLFKFSRCGHSELKTHGSVMDFVSFGVATIDQVFEHIVSLRMSHFCAVKKRTRCITVRAVSHENIGLRHSKAVVLWKTSSALVE